MLLRPGLPFHTVSVSGRLTCISGPPCPLDSTWALSGGQERLWESGGAPSLHGQGEVAVNATKSQLLRGGPLRQPLGLGVVVAASWLLCYPPLSLTVFLQEPTPL